MNGAILPSDNQSRFDPCLGAVPLGQIYRPHHTKKGNQRSVTLPKNHRPSADDDQTRRPRPRHHPLHLRRFGRKNTRKKPSRSEVARRRAAIIRHRAAQLKTTRQLLRMIAFHPRPQWKIRRTASHQIKRLVVPQHPRITKIPFPNVIAMIQSVKYHRAARQGHTLRLGLDRDQTRPRQPPRTNRRDCADPTPQIQHRARR